MQSSGLRRVFKLILARWRSQPMRKWIRERRPITLRLGRISLKPCLWRRNMIASRFEIEIAIILDPHYSIIAIISGRALSNSRKYTKRVHFQRKLSNDARKRLYKKVFKKVLKIILVLIWKKFLSWILHWAKRHSKSYLYTKSPDTV